MTGYIKKKKDVALCEGCGIIENGKLLHEIFSRFRSHTICEWCEKLWLAFERQLGRKASLDEFKMGMHPDQVAREKRQRLTEEWQRLKKKNEVSDNKRRRLMPQRNCVKCGIKDGVRSRLGELCKDCQQYCPACWEQKLIITQSGSTKYFECPKCGYQKIRQF